MNILFQVALAPSVICLIYIYIRDKYESEPIRLLAIGILYGIIISFPIVSTEAFLALFTPEGGLVEDAFYSSYVVAAGAEEIFKYMVLYFLVWRNKNFNEHFDGIVYAVFISLGFAGLENIMYVFNKNLGGMQTALARAVFSVPGHAFFGVTMGYYFAIAKFEQQKKVRLLFYAFLIPWFLHGTYNFLLLINAKYYLLLFIPLVVFMWISGFKKMNQHLSLSPFKNLNKNN